MRNIAVLFILFLLTNVCYAQKTIQYKDNALKLFPYEYSGKIDIKSPVNIDDREYLLAKTVNGKYTLIDVTVENGKPYDYYGKVRGKGNQLHVDGTDFPTLAKTGLHSNQELDNTKSITGRSIAEITMRGRPNRMSGAGFMADDEDIISVLKGDNNLVNKMNLTHPDLAKTIFHFWNIIQVKEEMENKLSITAPSIDTIFYNKKAIKYIVPSCRGWQDSVFEDTVMGECHLEMKVSLTKSESEFIRDNFKQLTAEQKDDMVKRLTQMHTGEMAAYYIQKYGFYEGHTDYRADPIILAYIFGLKSLQEIYKAYDGKVYENIINHHKSKF